MTDRSTTERIAELRQCAIVLDNGGTPPHDSHGCHLKIGHEGPHEFVANSGHMYRWETDWSCDCNDECGGDLCSVYWKVKDASHHKEDKAS